MNFIYYLPILTTIFGLFFLRILFLHWLNNKRSMHVLWWTLGVLCYIIGTIAESINTIDGFSIFNFKLWYISGALLGGAPLAQGSVYLLCKRKTADILAIILVTILVSASILVILSPVRLEFLSEGRLSGKLLDWQFIRAITPFINLYAFIFLVGGAAYSAIKYAQKKHARKRFLGNLFIALGGLLPGIGGTFTRLGHIEVLYVTELIGIILIFAGYRIIRTDHTISIYSNQKNRNENTVTGKSVII